MLGLSCKIKFHGKQIFKRNSDFLINPRFSFLSHFNQIFGLRKHFVMNADERKREDTLTIQFSNFFFSIFNCFLEVIKFHSNRTIDESIGKNNLKTSKCPDNLSPFRFGRKFIYFKDRSRHSHRDRGGGKTTRIISKSQLEEW